MILIAETLGAIIVLAVMAILVARFVFALPESEGWTDMTALPPAVRGQRIFIGSFNFDSRSSTLNTEMGLLIDSEQMAQGCICPSQRTGWPCLAGRKT